MKKALTLVEILLTFSIISLVIYTIIASMKPDKLMQNKSIQYAYTNVLDNLDGIAKEIVKDETQQQFLFYDNKRNDEMKFHFLCKKMALYLNNTGETCDVEDSFGYGNNNKKFLQSNINFANETPHITLVNGMKVFITSKISDKKHHKRFGYYLVYVDMIGESKRSPKGHHIVAQDANKYPEVFAFAIVPSGGVVPLGIAQIDSVLLPTYYEKFQKSNIMTYHEALHKAWGYYKKNTSPPFDETETYTYTNLISRELHRHSSFINKQFKQKNGDYIQYEYVPTTLYNNNGDVSCKVDGFTRMDVCAIKFKVNKPY